jgi:hypothetical protein
MCFLRLLRRVFLFCRRAARQARTVGAASEQVVSFAALVQAINDVLALVLLELMLLQTLLHKRHRESAVQEAEGLSASFGKLPNNA